MRILFLFLLLFSIEGFSQNTLVPQTGHYNTLLPSISPDGKMLLTAGSDGKVGLWDLSSYKCIKSSYLHRSAISSIEWNFDGRYFITASYDSTAVVWDAVTFEKLRTYHMTSPVLSASFNPKAGLIAIGNENGELLLYDLMNNEKVYQWKTGSGISKLIFTENGALLFAGTYKNGVKAYEMNQGKEVLSMEMKAAVFDMQLTSGSKLLLVHLNNGTTEWFEPITGKVLGSINHTIGSDRLNNEIWVTPVASADSKFIYQTDDEKNILITRVEDNMQHKYSGAQLTNKIIWFFPSPQNNYFLMGDTQGAMWKCYFRDKDFKEENKLYWHKLLYEPERIHRAEFADNDRKILMRGKSTYLFDLTNGDLQRREDDSSAIDSGTENIVLFSPDKMKDSTGYRVNYKDGTVNRFRVKSDYSTQNIPLEASAISGDSTTVAWIEKGELFIWSLPDKKMVTKIKVNPKHLFFNGTLYEHFVLSEPNKLILINQRSGEQRSFAHGEDLNYLYLCSDSHLKKLIGLRTNGKLIAFDGTSGKKINLPASITSQKFNSIEMSTDGKYFLGENTSQRIQTFLLENGNLIGNHVTDVPYILNLFISEDGTMAGYSDIDGIVHVYDVSWKKNLVNLIPSPANGLLAYSPENYYIATKEVAQSMVMTRDGKAVSFEQMDITLNRPEKVLENIGKADPDILFAYNRAYEKRMRRIGQSTDGSGVTPPLCEINNIHDLPFSVSSEKFKFTVRVSSSEGVNQVITRVNGVPTGKEKVVTSDQREIEVPLLLGNNKVEVYAIDKNGVQSPVQEFNLVSTRETPSELYLITIGTSQYQDSRFNLKYADKDARDFSKTLSSSKAFQKVHSLVLTNDQVTRGSLTRMEDFIKKAKPNDVVIVFVAGHGLRDEKMDYYFASYDINFNSPAEKGIADFELEHLLEKTQAIRKLMFFDTCLSGEIDKEDVEKDLAMKTTEEDISFRNTGAGLRTKTIGLQNAQFLMKELYNDLRKGSGATIISSAGGAEFAMESDQWSNGLFTYCLLNGLTQLEADTDKNKEVTLFELRDYILKEVRRMSGGSQIPDFRSANENLNFRIW